ncbi:hypothetical protein H4687_008264 [Streptomyces stelliscabiei]|uniref:Sugar ABC transporter substrate-binding protein n=1 Tax=Streptomyces stelliscabiei TaxID=146820 RepID=A0A8I0TUE1_9ACTN|nr:hypothetical protein [Streptomyces stelliscabiei]
MSVSPTPRRRRTRHVGAAVAALALTATAVATAGPASAAADLREVMFVGNNWEGTADVIKASGDFAKIGRINVIPDKPPGWRRSTPTRSGGSPT